jgi:hypothetical protein
LKAFDRKFGPGFLPSVPASPGVYRVYSADERLVYVGKAKNLRRRLSQYRNAKRLKRHARMKAVVAAAGRIEFEVCPSELDALLLENRLIAEHRPRLNVVGAFHFLYPMLGWRKDLAGTWLIYTTSPGLYPEYRFHGAYRSREITREGYESLCDLLAYIGHRVPMRAQPARRDRFTRIQGFRQLPAEWCELLEEFWMGRSTAAIESLVLALVDNAGARRRRREVQGHLDAIRKLWRFECVPLARARDRDGYPHYPVPQRERDPLFIRTRMPAAPAREGVKLHTPGV